MQHDGPSPLHVPTHIKGKMGSLYRVVYNHSTNFDFYLSPLLAWQLPLILVILQSQMNKEVDQTPKKT